MRESRFKNSFIFKYSARPGTKGDQLYADDVPEEVKRRRNNELLALQNAISEEDNQALIGRHGGSAGRRPEQEQPRSAAKTARVLQLTGRTHCDRIVVFEGNRRQIGQLLHGNRSTTPTPSRCSAAWSRSTSGPKYTTLG